MGECFFKKILMPVDQREDSKRAINFASALLSKVESIELSLLYVISGGYLSEHMKNIDFRTELVKKSEVIKKIREKHIEENIMPFLTAYEKNLRLANLKGTVSKIIEEGDVGNKIIEVATKQGFQTLIMARRSISELKGYIVGSVSNKVVHGLSNVNIYIVGKKVSETPVSRIIIPVDGSIYSMKAVEHVGCLANLIKGIQQITILRVINLSLYLERAREGIDPEAEAEEILSKSKKVLIDKGVPQELIETKSTVGFPREEIVKEIQEIGYDLVVIGRKGRSALKDIVLGSVSSSILGSCFDQTVAVINL